MKISRENQRAGQKERKEKDNRKGDRDRDIRGTYCIR